MFKFNKKILSRNNIYFKLLIFILIFYFILSFVFPSFTFAATPNNITDWLIKLATPAAAVAVGIGVFMKKFSFGDEERIRTAKKLIRGSLFSYAFILAIQLILSAIKSLVG